MEELILGPVQPWEPSEEDRATTARLLASEDELDIAYGEAYANRCFVGGIAIGEKSLTAVGELDALDVAEFRLGKQLDPQAMSLEAVIKLGAIPGRGETRVEQIRNGVRQVLEARDQTE
jgi:hypothetical protein